MKTYLFDRATNTGFEPCDILLSHYPNDTGFRTVVLHKEDLENIRPWQLCSLLNQAYESGKKDAMYELRRLIGAQAE